MGFNAWVLILQTQHTVLQKVNTTLQSRFREVFPVNNLSWATFLREGEIFMCVNGWRIVLIIITFQVIQPVDSSLVALVHRHLHLPFFLSQVFLFSSVLLQVSFPLLCFPFVSLGLTFQTWQLNNYCNEGLY